MRDRPTPETDAVFIWEPFLEVDVNKAQILCEKLERERDEAIRQRNETNESSKYAVDYAIRERDEYYARAASLVLHLPPETIAGEVQQWRDEFKADRENLIRERDEAQESLKHISEYGTEEINAAVELRQKLATALLECDEAREKLEEEMKWHHRTHKELVEAQCKLLDIEHDKLKS